MSHREQASTQRNAETQTGRDAVAGGVLISVNVAPAGLRVVWKVQLEPGHGS